MKTIAMFAATAALVMSSTAALSTPAMAADTGSGPNPYSDCGIGAALFPETPVAAVLSNVIWDIGITAIVSAVSSKETCNGKRATAAAYVSQTYASLEVDAARGEGQYLATLTDVMGCEASAKGEIYKAARTGLTDMMAKADFATMTKGQKAEGLFLAVDAAANASGRCYAA